MSDPRRLSLLALSVAVATACSAPERMYSREELLDPAICRSCHPQHYQEWSGSMHAYAAEDPVFRAMNARGQRETGGQLGSFCVQCHAPMALREGATTDGLNLASLPSKLHGVTCYFCHQVTDVEGSHNNPLKLASDDGMRGGLPEAIETPAHRTVYSPLHDRTQRASSALCGSCHDVVTPAPHNVHLERAYLEWSESVFGKLPEAGSPASKSSLTCGQCHLPGRSGRAAERDGAPERLVHDHSMPGVDVALTPFPETEAQRKAVQRELDISVLARLCVGAEGTEMVAELSLENLAAGHGFPSGASHDRRLWVEIAGYRGTQLYWSSGIVPDRFPAVEVAAADPNMWLFYDRAFKTDGRPAHMFWDVARVEPNALVAAVTNDPRDPRYFHGIKRTFRIPVRPLDRITVEVRIRPIDDEVLQDLVDSGDLNDVIRARVPTFTLNTARLEWTPTSKGCVP